MFTPTVIGLVLLAAAIVAVVFRKEFRSKKSGGAAPQPSAPSIPEISALDLRERLTKSTAPVVVLFTSPTCPHCTTQKENFEEAKATHTGGAQFVTINVMDNKSTARRLGINRIPYTMVFVSTDETPLDKRVGLMDPSAVNAFIANALKVK